MILAFLIVNNYGRARHLKFYTEVVSTRPLAPPSLTARERPRLSSNPCAAWYAAGAAAAVHREGAVQHDERSVRDIVQLRRRE